MSNQVDHSQCKLGKRAPSPATLRKLPRFEKYLKALPPYPVSGSWGKRVTRWGEMLNDRIGDCAIACPGHMVQAWTTYELGNEVTIPDSAILKSYSDVSGYDPRTGANDNGCVVADVLKYWRTTGIGGHKIDAYASIQPKNIAHFKAGLWLFGGLYLGVSLPQTAQNQKIWSVPSFGPVGPGAPGSWGGHAIACLAYGPGGVTVVTWGALKQVTWGFLATYCDEAYSILSVKDWSSDGHAPSGFATQQLIDDLRSL